MKRGALWIFLGTVGLLYLLKALGIDSQWRFFIGAFGFGGSVVYLIVYPLMSTFKDEP